MEASTIKIKIQNARTVVESMPSVQRTPMELREEMEELEEGISAQRKVIQNILISGSLDSG